MNLEPMLSEALIVGVDFSNGKDEGVLIVGRKRMNQTAEIINAFTGEEAYELYKKLVTKREKERASRYE